MLSFSISVEPLTLLFIAAINCEYTLIQYSVSTSHCLKLANLTDPLLCETPKSGNISTLIKDDVTVSIRYYNGLLSFFCSLATLFTGSWSDCYGRRLPIIFAIISSIIAQIFCIIFWLTLDSNQLWLIYAAGLVSGLSGSSSSLIANCFGYIADLTSVADRSRAMAIMEAMLYLGNAIGFSSGSLLVNKFGGQLVLGFGLLLIVHSGLLLYTLCYLKESKQSTQRPTIKGLFRLSHIVTVFQTIGHQRDPPSKRSWLITIVFTAFVALLTSNAMSSILYVFLRNQPLNWTSDLYGYLSSLNYLIGGITLLVLVPLAHRFCPNLVKDDFMAVLGFTSRAAGLIVLGLSQSSLQAFLAPLAFIFSELTLPSLRSMVSKLVEPDEKGKAFAFLGLLSNVALFLGSQASSFIYQRTSNWFPGLVLVILGLIEILPITIYLVKCILYSDSQTVLVDAADTCCADDDSQSSSVGGDKKTIKSDIDIRKSIEAGIDKLTGKNN